MILLEVNRKLSHFAKRPLGQKELDHAALRFSSDFWVDNERKSVFAVACFHSSSAQFLKPAWCFNLNFRNIPGYCSQQTHFCDCFRNIGHFLSDTERVKRFVKVDLHCIVSNLKRISKISTLPPLKKFLRMPMVRTTALGGLGIPHGQQQFQIVLLASHQYETKQGRRCGHST